jgi:hypothetical protein
MDEFGKLALRERQALRIARRQRFWLHFVVWVALSVFLVIIWGVTTHGFPWFLFPICAWAVIVAAHAAYAYLLKDPEEILMEREKQIEEEKQA